MMLEKLWRAAKAQANKLVNLFWTYDPIAQMQYEYDLAVEQFQAGREGLEQYRALVERIAAQVANDRKHGQQLEARVEAYLEAGDRDTAGRFALELDRLRERLEEGAEQLALHEQAYMHNLAKIKQATARLGEVRERIAHHDAQLKMTKAEAEIAKLAGSFDLDASTNLGQIEQIIDDKINLNRARTRVAGDLSETARPAIEREQAVEKALAEKALRNFETTKRVTSEKTIVIAQEPKRIAGDNS